MKKEYNDSIRLFLLARIFLLAVSTTETNEISLSLIIVRTADKRKINPNKYFVLITFLTFRIRGSKFGEV